MLVDTQPKTEEHRFSRTDQARALAVVLRQEFGVPFAFYDAETGEPVWQADDLARPPAEVFLEPAEVLQLVRDGRARVTLSPERRYQVALLLYSARQPAFLAAGVVPGAFGPPAPPATERELGMVRSWVQAVGDRLRLTDQLLYRRRSDETQQAQVTASWEALLALDQLARRL
ncbi:MAG: hypothetical protein L0Z62_37745, partial [Gemmataceae bacterium]|nr:hypothetical protein [Gemmataceae bacterium]